MASETTSTPAPPVGVIEALAAGFETAAGHFALLLLPLLLDLFLWVGPRLSLQPVWQVYYEQEWLPFLESSGEQWQEGSAVLTEMLKQAADEKGAHYLPLLVMPSLMASRLAQPLPFDFVPPLLQVRTLEGLPLLTVAMPVVGSLLVTFYAGLIAQQVQNGRIRFGRLLADLPGMWLRVMLLGLLLPVIAFAIWLPFLMLGFVLALFSQAIGLVVIIMGGLFVLWVLVFMIFTVHGLYMNERGLLGALWDSVRVVQWNQPATMLLLLLVLGLNTVLTQYVWLRAVQMPGSWLPLVGIIGHAFITTGLLTATFVFYQDRYRHWRELRAKLLADLEQRRSKRQRG